MNRTLTLLSTLALAVGLAPQASAVSYVDDAQPVLSAKCVPCHTSGASGQHSIGENYADGQLDSYFCADLTKAACSIERIEDGSMPSGMGCDGPVADDAANADVCVTESEFDVLEAWIAAGAPEEAVAVPDPGCTSDDDCGEGEVCASGDCVEDGGVDPDPDPVAECASDDDCNEGDVCASGACVDGGGDVVPEPACTTDADCGEGFSCQAGLDGSDECVGTNMPNPDDGNTGGGASDGGGCQTGGGPLGGLMLMLAGLALLATRRSRDWRRPFPSLR